MSGAQRWWPAALVLWLCGCGSPLVGLTCLPGYSQCGEACYDLQSDVQHCGGCTSACLPGQTCGEGKCLGEPVFPDAGVDGQVPEGGPADAGPPLPPPKPLCEGPDSPDDCVCRLGEAVCPGKACKKLGSDPANCGECGKPCTAGQFCIGGQCIDDCDPPLKLCGVSCYAVQTDPANCGDCGVSCSTTGLCSEGACVADVAGHVVLIGHSFREARDATRQLLGQAVALGASRPVKVLAFEGDADPAVVTSVDSAIDDFGPAWEKLPGTPLSVPFLLSIADVLLIYAQGDTTDEVLQKHGEGWSQSLGDFLERGGTVVAMDGGGNHSGTFQILRSAGVFNVTGRAPLNDPELRVTDSGLGDAVTTNLPLRYAGPRDTVRFESFEGRVVVEEAATGAPVVIHRAR